VDPWLVDVGGLEHEWIMTFHSVGNFILPTDVHSMIFRVGQPPTTSGVGNIMIFPYKWGTEGPLTQRNGEFSKQDVDFGGLN